jgi:hypothetical protein
MRLLFCLSRALKRTKAYASFNNVRPTIRNKPSGLVGNWSQVLTKAGSPLHQSPPSALSTRSSSSSSSSQLLSPSPLTSSWQQESPSQLLSPSPLTSSWQQESWQQEVFPMMSNTGPLGPVIPVLDAVAPFTGQTPFPFQFHAHNYQAANNVQQYPQAAHTPQTVGSYPPPQVHSFPRRYRDEGGNLHTPGVNDLPHGIKINFRNTFIRHIMRLVLSGTEPWTNPKLPLYQQEFAAIYPGVPYQIHANDAVRLSVSISSHQKYQFNDMVIFHFTDQPRDWRASKQCWF